MSRSCKRFCSIAHYGYDVQNQPEFRAEVRRLLVNQSLYITLKHVGD